MNEHSTFALETTLTALLESKKYASLRDVLSTMNPSDIAAVFDKMEQDTLPLLLPQPCPVCRRDHRGGSERRGGERRDL